MTYIKKILCHISRLTAWGGMCLLLLAMGTTTFDVILRHINKEGIYGSVDIVQLLIMGAAYLSIPYGFLKQSHVSVTIIADMFSHRFNAVTHFLAAILATGLMMAIAWFGFQQAMLHLEYGDISLTLAIPKIYYWIPLLFGSLLSACICLFLTLEACLLIMQKNSQTSSKNLEKIG